MRLPDPQQSYAVLIGTSTYQSPLDDLPAVRNNIYDLETVLTNPLFGGIPSKHCVVIPDPADARAAYRKLREYALQAKDTLIVYFAGHGLVGPRNDLYLGLSDTDPAELAVSALAYEVVRDVLGQCGAANRVVILDCCFSGRAISDMAGSESALLGQLAIEGTYVLTSAPVNGVSLAPAGAVHTAFTGELLRLLRDGVPDGPEFLTCGEIYRRLLHTAMARSLPIPQQRGTGTIDGLALSRNSAFLPDGQHTTHTVHPSNPAGPTNPARLDQDSMHHGHEHPTSPSGGAPHVEPENQPVSGVSTLLSKVLLTISKHKKVCIWLLSTPLILLFGWPALNGYLYNRNVIYAQAGDCIYTKDPNDTYGMRIQPCSQPWRKDGVGFKVLLRADVDSSVNQRDLCTTEVSDWNSKTDKALWQPPVDTGKWTILCSRPLD